MPDPRDLPDHGLPEAYDGLRYIVQVYSNGNARSYSYANPSLYPRPQDASVACMADLLRGVADREVKCEKERAVQRGRTSRETEAKLDAIVGRTFESLQTQSHGKLVRIRVTRREQSQFVLQHSTGITRVPCQEILAIIEKTRKVQDESTVPSKAAPSASSDVR